MDKFNEIFDELKLVFSGHGPGVLDALVPLLVYIIGGRFLTASTALYASLGAALAIMIYRLANKQSVAYSAGGAGTALLGALLAYLGNTEAGFYLPGFVSGGLTVAACLVSAVFRKPLAAYSSHLTRRWPLDWYWHEQVRPAYGEVTLMWAGFFGLRLATELILFIQGNTSALGTVRVLMGWPFTILVLVISYVYGQKRLVGLGGPSVEEFETNVQPPWEGQRRGF